jgi:hypothetical protein
LLDTLVERWMARTVVVPCSAFHRESWPSSGAVYHI